MNIEKLISILNDRLKIKREYADINGHGLPWKDLERYENHMRKHKDCLGCVPVLFKDSYAASDLALLGPGQQEELSIRLGVELPSDYLRFCSRFEEYFFVGSAYIIASNAADIVDSITAARDVLDIPQSTKHRLFHFARIINQSGYYSFRWSEDSSKMDIVFVWDYGDVTVADLLGPDGDRYVSDANFTSWLSRMIESDGNSLFPEKRWPMASGEWFDDDYNYLERRL